MPRDPAIEAAYRAAVYRVDAPGESFDLSIGLAAPALDRLLARAGADRWAYVTAANPASLRLEEEENARRLARLDAEIARRGWRAIPGASLDPEGFWPAEASRLLLGVEEAAARALARRFGQIAFVAGERGAPPRLCWVEADAPAG